MLLHADNDAPVTIEDLAVAYYRVTERMYRRSAAEQTPGRNAQPTGLRHVTTRGKGIRKVRYHGIGRAAQELGVTRFHLLRVIQGQNKSRRIQTWLRTHLQRAS